MCYRFVVLSVIALNPSSFSLPLLFPCICIAVSTYLLNFLFVSLMFMTAFFYFSLFSAACNAQWVLPLGSSNSLKVLQFSRASRHSTCSNAILPQRDQFTICLVRYLLFLRTFFFLFWLFTSNWISYWCKLLKQPFFLSFCSLLYFNDDIWNL